MMGGMQSKARMGDFARQWVAAKAPLNVATSWTAPKGMLNRMVVKLLNPNDLTINGPKVEIPPDGIDTAVSMENHSQVFTSSKHSVTWSQRQTPDEMPIWFMRRRSMASSLSSLVRNFACIGESGRKRKTTIENATVKHPQNRKMI